MLISCEWLELCCIFQALQRVTLHQVREELDSLRLDIHLELQVIFRAQTDCCRKCNCSELCSLGSQLFLAVTRVYTGMFSIVSTSRVYVALHFQQKTGMSSPETCESY